MKKIIKLFIALIMVIGCCMLNSCGKSDDIQSETINKIDPSVNKNKVISYLETNGSTLNGLKNCVCTGKDTYLSFESGCFITCNKMKDGDYLYLFLSYSSYNEKTLSCSFTIQTSTTKIFDCDYSINISNHQYGSTSNIKISVNKYPSLNSTVASIQSSMQKEAINNCSSYLSSKGLPYIY